MSPQGALIGSSSSPAVESNKPTGAVREVRCYSGGEISTQSDEDRNVCWICLESDTPSHPLEQPCKCPRYCHLRCLARWQLQSAGTKREFECDFCNCRLPDWRRALSLQNDVNAPAVMNVNFEGRTYSFEVKPGPSGYLQFTEAIRHAFQLPLDSELNITFTCDEPCNEEGSLLTLQGPGAYDAAVYCASVSAARRQTCHRRAHTVSGTRLVNEPARGVERYGQNHYRSHTLDTQFGPVTRREQYSPRARNSHSRSRSHPAFPVARRSQRHHLVDTTHPHSHKGWARVVRKFRALYHRLTNK